MVCGCKTHVDVQTLVRVKCQPPSVSDVVVKELATKNLQVSSYGPAVWVLQGQYMHYPAEKVTCLWHRLSCSAPAEKWSDEQHPREPSDFASVPFMEPQQRSPPTPVALAPALEDVLLDGAVSGCRARVAHHVVELRLVLALRTQHNVPLKAATCPFRTHAQAAQPAHAATALAAAGAAGTIDHNSTESVWEASVFVLPELPGHRVRRQGTEVEAVAGRPSPPGEN